LLSFSVVLFRADSRGYEVIDIRQKAYDRAKSVGGQETGSAQQAIVHAPEFRREARDAGCVPPV
jgi:hypothetical protein